MSLGHYSHLLIWTMYELFSDQSKIESLLCPFLIIAFLENHFQWESLSSWQMPGSIGRFLPLELIRDEQLVLTICWLGMSIRYCKSSQGVLRFQAKQVLRVVFLDQKKDAQNYWISAELCLWIASQKPRSFLCDCVTSQKHSLPRRKISVLHLWVFHWPLAQSTFELHLIAYHGSLCQIFVSQAGACQRAFPNQ